MQAHGSDIPHDMTKFFLIGQLIRLFQIGVLLVRLTGHDDVRDELQHELSQQVEDKVLGQDDDDDLSDSPESIKDHDPEIFYIGLLVGQKDGVFVAQQIGAGRICHIHQINEPQILDAAAVLDEEAQERHQRKAHQQNDHRDDAV